MNKQLKKQLVEEVSSLVKFVMRNCFLCKKEVESGEPFVHFVPIEGALYLRCILICDECNSLKPWEVPSLDIYQKIGELAELEIATRWHTPPFDLDDLKVKRSDRT